MPPRRKSNKFNRVKIHLSKFSSGDIKISTQAYNKAQQFAGTQCGIQNIIKMADVLKVHRGGAYSSRIEPQDVEAAIYLKKVMVDGSF